MRCRQACLCREADFAQHSRGTAAGRGVGSQQDARIAWNTSSQHQHDDRGSQRLLIYEQRLWSTNYPHNTDSGAEFYNTKGQMFLSRRGKLTVLGDRNAAVNLDVELKPQDDAAHVRNFCDCIRSGTKPNADALTGHLSTSLAHLANIATRVGRSLSFDPIKERFLGDDEANKLIRREYREHWGTPRNARA